MNQYDYNKPFSIKINNNIEVLVKRFEINKYKALQNIVIKNPSNLFILTGLNGSGKSSVLNAFNDMLSYCFIRNIDPINGMIQFEIDGSSSAFREFFELVFSLSETLSRQLYHTISRPFNINSQSEINPASISDMLLHLKRALNEDLNLFRTKILVTIRGNVSIREQIKTNFQINSEVMSEKYSTLRQVVQNCPEGDFNYYLGYLIHIWMRSRYWGYNKSPNYAFLDTETVNLRSPQLNYGDMPTTVSQRLIQLPNQGHRIRNLGTRLLGLMQDYTSEMKIDSIMDESFPMFRINFAIKKLIPHLQIIPPKSIDTSIRFLSRGKEVDIQSLSSGEILIVNYCLDYLDMEVHDGFILIDEPVAHLHYDMQYKFVSFIQALVNNKSTNSEPTIWITTHSPAIISSVAEENIKIVNISDVDDPIIDYKNQLGTDSDSRFLKLMGLTNIFSFKPSLFVEGKSDVEFIDNIISAKYENSEVGWRIFDVSGIDELERFEGLINGLIKASNNYESFDLSNFLKLAHFIKDRDFSKERKTEDNTFTWELYSIENIIFQDPWKQYLPDIMRIKAKNTINLDADLINVAKIVFENNREHMAKSYENYQIEELTRVLPGKQLYNELKRVWDGGSTIEILMDKLIEKSIETRIFPNEINRFTFWLSEMDSSIS